MAASGAISVFPLFFLLFGLGGTPVPLGIPPLPEDAVLSRMAPPECLAYLAWSGTAEPDGKSENQTELLMAEPEVQAFAAKVEAEIVRATTSGPGGRQNPQAAIVGIVYPLAKQLLTRPTALYLGSVTMGPPGPNVDAGAVCNLGAEIDKVKATLENLQKNLPPDSVKTTEVAGVSCYQITMGPGPSITWGVKGKYLIVGVGEGSFAGILKRARGKAPAWLAALRKQMPVERLSTVFYVNTKKIINDFAPMGGPQVATVLEATGLGKVTSLAAVTGLDGQGFVSRTAVAIDGEPSGLLSLAAGKPLTADDLAPIPADATLAAAGRFSADEAVQTITAMVTKIDARNGQQMTDGLAAMENGIGIKLRDDILQPLGNVWCIYNSPREGGFLITGMTAVVQVKDRARLAAALEKLVALADAQMQRGEQPGGPVPQPMMGRPSPKIERFDFAGQKIFFFNARSNDFVLAPAWCLTEKELIVATFPQQIKAYMSRGKEAKSLATVPDVAKLFEDKAGPVSISYLDTRRVAATLYPVLCFGGQALTAEFARQGIPLDVSVLPSATALLPHLGPSISTVRRTAAGIEFSNCGTLPGGGGASLPVLTGLLLPAVQKARGSARNVQSMNNMKQIGLAMHNYASVYNTFPPAYIADKKTGKPLLSWRVAILPFLEEDALYKQFHLDEPWDSKNNRPLADRLPAVYRSPQRNLAPGTTVYLTFRNKDSAFPGKDGVRFADITDGMSNTIMLVEADSAKQTVWTKPDDLEFDPQNPLAGLTGDGIGHIIAAFCDGSVRALTMPLDAETMRNLVNRHDGNPINMPGQ